MAPIVAPLVARFSVNQQLAGQQVVNVIDMQITNISPFETREDALFSKAGDILNNWSDHILAFQCDDIQALSVSWLDIDSLDGSRGERSSTDDHSWPMQGGNVSQGIMPGMVAARVDKATAGGRGTKAGRMYLAAMPEARTDDGSALSWSAGTVTTINEYLDDFLNGINGTEGAGPLDEGYMVVVHTRDGEWTDSTPVTALTLNPLVSTQVRRGALR